MISVYEAANFLYGVQEELLGKSVTLEYLPTKRSRKWRTSYSIKSYSEVCYNAAFETLNQNNWYSIRFVENK